MHWSRLVDAPIAAIILVVTAVTGSQATGETVALIAWPLALYALALYLLLRIGRLWPARKPRSRCSSSAATTLYYTGLFAPGAIDHHNVQLVLMLAMVLFLLRADTHQPLGLARRHRGSADAGGRHGDRALCRGRRPFRRRLVPRAGRRGERHRGRLRCCLCGDVGRRLRRDGSRGRMGRCPLRRLFGGAVRNRRACRRRPCGRRIDAGAQSKLRIARGVVDRARRRGGNPCIDLFPAMPRRSLRAARPQAPELLARRCRRGAAALEHPGQGARDGRRPLCDGADRVGRAGAHGCAGMGCGESTC